MANFIIILTLFLIIGDNGYVLGQSDSKEREPGKISNEMCKVYSQYVWDKNEDKKSGECPFDKVELMIGGKPASSREFPHMVQIGFEGSGKIDWLCTGSLISDQFVLSAAHCLTTLHRGDAIYARMGLTDINHSEQSQQYNITEIIRHPQYQTTNFYDDIGLVKLDRKVQLNSYVRPVCLHTNNSTSWSKAVGSGWGATSHSGQQSDVLQKVVVKIYDNPECQKVYTTMDLSQGIRDELMICAGIPEPGQDICQGFAGAPLQVYRNNTDSEMSCMYDVVGITSFGKPCGTPDVPGVFTRVSNYVKWIEDIVWPPA